MKKTYKVTVQALALYDVAEERETLCVKTCHGLAAARAFVGHPLTRMQRGEYMAICNDCGQIWLVKEV